MIPIQLRCEYNKNPLGIDQPNPRLSWWLDSTQRIARQTAYQIVAATSIFKLQAGTYDLWNSHKVTSDQSTLITYAGKPLKSGSQVFWKVRVWDGTDQLSPWSETNTWSMGLLSPSDWQGQWIAATERISNSKSVDLTGYHALESATENNEKWVQIDLGKPQKIDSIIWHIPSPKGYEGKAGFGVPVRFRIESSSHPDFSPTHNAEIQSIYNHSQADFSHTSNDPINFPVSTGRRQQNITARYIRITATKLWNRKTGSNPYCFAIAEIEVISNKKNIAQGAKVTAKDSVEFSGWSLQKLTDGTPLSGKNTSSSASGLSKKNTAPDPQNAAIMLRKEFQTSGKIKRATAYLCGLGYSELFLNGNKISNHVLDPGFTAFDHRSLYLTYDVTSQLRKGQNAVGILLGGGWFNLATSDLFGFESSPWSATPRANLRLEIQYENGKSTTITTDKSWKWSTGEITFNCIRGGETIDHRKDQPGWTSTSFNDSNWYTPIPVSAPKGKLVAQQHSPIRAHGVIKPVIITNPKPGVYVFDLGVNIAGWASLTTQGTKGSKITLEYNEKLNADGTGNMLHTSSHTYGRFQREEFILAGTGKETFEPRFTYHGFRYVQVSGLTQKPTVNTLFGKWVTTDLNPAGSFSCSNERINLLQTIFNRTILNNMHGIPTDCPQREKMGWMDDGCVMMEASIYNFDAINFYRKWIGDMVDSQDPNGHVPDIVPTSGWGRSTGLPGNMADPWWGGAIVFSPWKLYQYYGDTRILQENYPAMKGYVDYLTSTAKGNIVDWGLGDWLDESAGGGGRRVPVAQTSTAAYFYATQIIADSAKLLGNNKDGNHYSTLAQSIKTSFNSAFLQPSGAYASDSQTAQSIPLFLGLVPSDMQAMVLDKLTENLTTVRKNQISAGIVGTLYVFQALTQAGRDDLAWNMLKREEYPGWLHMINQGATSLWEDWKGENSLNHPTLGCVGFWLYQGLGGIRPNPMKPGFKNFTIKPYIPSDLKWVNCSFPSIHGEIHSNWKQLNGKLTLQVTVPPNTSATVYVPTNSPDTVTESGQSTAKAIGVKSSKTLQGVAGSTGFKVFEVGSGTYLFESELSPNPNY